MKKFIGFLLLFFLYLLSSSDCLAAPAITNITDNRGSYTGSQIPKYEKLEINFAVTTVAENLQWPYDASPPSGVTAGKGVSADAVFTNPQGLTFTQPGFYYQPYIYQVKGSSDWLYPQGQAIWLVRFAPNMIGSWSYKLKVQDSSGTTESSSVNFAVAENTNLGLTTGKGFIRVSKNDPRYFEYDNGSYFPSLGYNMNYDELDWRNPVQNTNNQLKNNTYNFQKMGENGIQLVRMWLSEWSIFSSEWNPWYWLNGGNNWYYLTIAQSYLDHGVSMVLNQSENQCMASGNNEGVPIAVKPNTNYRVRVRFKAVGLTGPRVSGYAYGFAAKIPVNGWEGNCMNPDVGPVVAKFSSDMPNWNPNADWMEMSGTYQTGSGANFIPAFYLTLNNISSGQVYVDHVWMEEDLGSGNFGPNIIIKAGINHQHNFDQRQSFAFDKVLDLAKQNNVYLRPVIMEKQDWILNSINWEGQYTSNNTSQTTQSNFYSNLRNLTHVRWLQRSWWRYLQARWGYSTNIQSWELLNEGDPYSYSDQHSILADEFAIYMHQFKPNDHLISTSNWNSYPYWFWRVCANCDFADVHQYMFKTTDTMYWRVRTDTDTSGNFSWGTEVTVGSPADYPDSAKLAYNISNLFGAKQIYGFDKPVIRGETGFVGSTNSDNYDTELAGSEVKAKIAMHNYIWAGIGSGGLIESYWYEIPHVYNSSFDVRSQYGNYYKFIKDVPLSNGKYADALASGPTRIRAWGQKDTVNGRAHLWIANSNYRWDNQNPSGVSGNVTIAGFTSGVTYKMETWDTYTGTITNTQNVTATSGTITIPVANLSKDFAVRIGDYSNINPSPQPSPTPCGKTGDVNGDCAVNYLDLKQILSAWGTSQLTYIRPEDIDQNSVVNALDVAWVILNWNK